MSEDPERYAGPCPRCGGGADDTERFDWEGESWCECASCGHVWSGVRVEEDGGCAPEIVE